MKKAILILILINAFSTFSQKTTYGLVLGINATDTENGPYSGHQRLIFSNDAPGLDGFNVGIYLDLPLNKKFGLKSYLTYNNENETYYSNTFQEYDFEININSVQFSSALKYHFKEDYNQGFYLLTGPRITHTLNTKNKRVPALNDIHKKYNFGLQFGFGFTLYEFIKTEFIADYGLSNIIELDNIEVKAYNLKLNLNFNIEHIIK